MPLGNHCLHQLESPRLESLDSRDISCREVQSGSCVVLIPASGAAFRAGKSGATPVAARARDSFLATIILCYRLANRDSVPNLDRIGGD